MPDKNITFHLVLSDPEIRSPSVNYTYISFVYFVTKEQKLSYEYIKHSKHRKRIMSIIIHSCALSFTVFILKMSRGKPSFRMKAPESAVGRRRAASWAPAIGSMSPLQHKTPPWWKFSPGRRTSVHLVTDCYSARWLCRRSDSGRCVRSKALIH